MKYIKTKDNIYELMKTKNGEEYLVRVGEFIPLWNTKEYEIIKQADTIEELCDEFVVVHKDGTHITETRKYMDIPLKVEQETLSYWKRNEQTFYGAIWTDKGLIYKAKMKGILPNGEIDWELL